MIYLNDQVLATSKLMNIHDLYLKNQVQVKQFKLTMPSLGGQNPTAQF